MAISQSFNSKDCPAFDAARFWLQSLMTAECCKKIAAADKQADDVIRDLAYSAGLSKAFMAEFATDHRDMTSELAKIWSLPAPMAAAYRYRSFADSHDDERLGLIVSAGIIVVENVDADESQRTSLDGLAQALRIDVDRLQKMAMIGERQIERVESLASNMTA